MLYCATVQLTCFIWRTECSNVLLQIMDELKSVVNLPGGSKLQQEWSLLREEIYTSVKCRRKRMFRCCLTVMKVCSSFCVSFYLFVCFIFLASLLLRGNVTWKTWKSCLCQLACTVTVRCCHLYIYCSVTSSLHCFCRCAVHLSSVAHLWPEVQAK